MKRKPDRQWEVVTVQTERGGYQVKGHRVGGWLVTQTVGDAGIGGLFSVTHPATGRALEVGMWVEEAERLAWKLARRGLTGDMAGTEVNRERLRAALADDTVNPPNRGTHQTCGPCRHCRANRR